MNTINNTIKDREMKQMKLGICIEGGGAKGAYEAGVIKALYDNGIKTFEAASGTSIGAINAYFIMTGNSEAMFNMWNNVGMLSNGNLEIKDNLIDNSGAIDVLRKFEGAINGKLYVNYLKVDKSEIEEIVAELSGIEKEKALEYIMYSSRLPFNPNRKLKFRDQFALDVKEGLYDGFSLDGGLVRNVLLEPLLNEDLDKIVVISTKDDYRLPAEVLEKADEDKFIIIRPDYTFDSDATLRFEEEFCRDIFRDGYKFGMDAVKKYNL